MGRAFLTDDSAKKIKERIWNGDLQSAIAKDFEVSEAMVSHIATGRHYWNTEWPDGRKGELPRDRVLELRRAQRTKSQGYQNSTSVLTEKEKEELSRRLEQEDLDSVDTNVDTDQTIEVDAPWEECALILGATHKLIKQGARDKACRAKVQNIVGRLPLAQRTKENVERLYAQWITA